MNPINRRDQGEVLQELFDEQTAGLSQEMKLMWLFDLFHDHIRRLEGVMQSLKRPLYPEFFGSDFIVNLHLVNALIVQQLESPRQLQAEQEEWQAVVDTLETATKEKSDPQVVELIGLFDSAFEKISAAIDPTNEWPKVAEQLLTGLHSGGSTKLLQFSIRQMLIGMFLLAAMFAMGSVYKSWSEKEIEQKYTQYRILQLMSLLEDGQTKAEIEKQFLGMFAIDGAMGDQILAQNPKLVPSDLVYGVPIGDSYARFLFFRDDRLIGHNLDAAEMQNTIDTIQLSTPPWYLQHGHWVIGPAVVLVCGLFVLVFRLVRRKQRNAT